MTYSSVAGLIGELYIIPEMVLLRVVTYSWSDLVPRCDIFPQWSDSAECHLPGVVRLHGFWYSRSGQTPRNDVFQEWSDSAESHVVKLRGEPSSRSGQTPRSLLIQESKLVCWWPLLCVQGPLQYRTCPWVTCKWSRDSSPSLSGKYYLESILTAFTVLQYKAAVTLDSKHT